MAALVRPSRHQCDVLTPLQAEVWRVIGRLGKDHGFALAGGAALIAYGIIDRPTSDLDVVGPSGVTVEAFVEQVERELQSLSFRTERITDYPQLVRMRIHRDDEELGIDIGVDCRSLAPVATRYGLLLDELDVAGGKVDAFVNRREPRDLDDLIALEARHGLETLCRLAAEKDPTFRPGELDMALKGIESDPTFDVDPAVIARWRSEIPLLGPVREESGFEIDF